jgi:hypothetical protein
MKTEWFCRTCKYVEASSFNSVCSPPDEVGCNNCGASESEGQIHRPVSDVGEPDAMPPLPDRDRDRASTAGHDTTAELAAYLERRGALPEDSAARKTYPMCAGLLDYFPDALAEVARGSYVGNEKHNPGEPLHHARGKSMDHADCIVRHLAARGTWDTIVTKDGREFKVRHSTWVAWRALALLQEELEIAGAPLARGARKAGEK